MAEPNTPITTLFVFDALATMSGALRERAHNDHDALLELLTHVGEVSNAAPDWPAITGSADDMDRAKCAVVRMGFEIEGLIEALEQERAKSAGLSERLADASLARVNTEWRSRVADRPSATSVGAAIHDEERIRQIVREALDSWLEPRAEKLVRSQSKIIRQIAREEIEAGRSERAADRMDAAIRRAAEARPLNAKSVIGRRPQPIPDPLAEPERIREAVAANRAEHESRGAGA